MRSSQFNGAQKKMGMVGTTRRFKLRPPANPLILFRPAVKNTQTHPSTAQVGLARIVGLRRSRHLQGHARPASARGAPLKSYQLLQSHSLLLELLKLSNVVGLGRAECHNSCLQ